MEARTDVFAWRQNTGVSRRHIRFGRNGAADITGILRGGRRLEIETKTATGKQSDAQVEFQAEIERMGGLYILARSVEDVATALEGV